MKNYPDNVKNFIEEIAPFVETPIQTRGILLIPIKLKVLADPDKFIPFFKDQVVPLKERLNLQRYFKLSVTTNPPGFAIDLALMHREKLASAFKKVPQPEIQESVKFLTDLCGWSEEQFQREYGISAVTLYRYRTGKFQGKRKDKESSNEVILEEHAASN